MTNLALKLTAKQEEILRNSPENIKQQFARSALTLNAFGLDADANTVLANLVSEDGSNSEIAIENRHIGIMDGIFNDTVPSRTFKCTEEKAFAKDVQNFLGLSKKEMEASVDVD